MRTKKPGWKSQERILTQFYRLIIQTFPSFFGSSSMENSDNIQNKKLKIDIISKKLIYKKLIIIHQIMIKQPDKRNKMSKIISIR